MKKFLSFFFILAASCAFSNAQTADAKTALIDELLTLTKADSLMLQAVDQFKQSFSQGFEKSFNDQVTQNHDDPAKYQSDLPISSPSTKPPRAKAWFETHQL